MSAMMRQTEEWIRAIYKGPMLLSALLPGELTVVATFSRSIYARTAKGDVICFCGEDLPMGPLTLMCAPWPPSLAVRPGDVWMPADDAIAVSRKTRIALNDVAAWEPTWLQRLDATPCERALARLRKTDGSCFSVQNGLAALLPEVLNTAWTQGQPIPAGSCGIDGKGETGCLMAQALIETGREGVRALDEWLSTPPGQTFPPARQRVLESLLGLGPGLTPSGDDVLCGALLALHGLGLPERASRLGAALGAARERTGLISHAYLRAATAGYGSSVLHEAITALCTDSPALFDAVQALGRIGHSSGWDAFLGAVCVCNRARMLMEQRMDG
jgi:hypothetical protein